MKGHSDGKNRSPVCLPGKSFLKRRRRIQVMIIGLIGPPRPNLAIFVATPNQPIGVVSHQTHDGRGVSRFLIWGGVLVPSQDPATEAAAEFISVLEMTNSQATLLPGPQLRLGAGNVSEELSHLSFPEGMGPQLQARRATGMDGSAGGHLEDPSPAAAANELWEGLALVAGIVRGAVRTEGLVESLVVGGVRKEFVVGRLVDEDLGNLGVI